MVPVHVSVSNYFFSGVLWKRGRIDARADGFFADNNAILVTHGAAGYTCDPPRASQ